MSEVYNQNFVTRSTMPYVYCPALLLNNFEEGINQGNSIY